MDQIQYSHNNGGLNNQKLALLGLFLEAHRLRLPLRLPAFFNLDHTNRDERRVPFGDVFSFDRISAFAERWQIEIAGKSTEDAPDVAESWPYFGVGASHIAGRTAAGEMTPEDIACDFVRSLRPNVCDSDEFHDLKKAVFEHHDIQIVVQLRIESDWKLFAAITLDPTVGDREDYFPPFLEILRKVRNTFNGTCPMVYIVCDEAALIESLDEIRSVVKAELDINLVWKSDILGKDFSQRQNILDLSLIDFEMAVQPPHFVGLTRSTFSNVATFQRYADTRADVQGHYVYNGLGPLLKRRVDNGAYATVEAATTGRP